MLYTYVNIERHELNTYHIYDVWLPLEKEKEYKGLNTGDFIFIFINVFFLKENIQNKYNTQWAHIVCLHLRKFQK